MPRLFDVPQRDVVAMAGNDDVHADIAELLASTPPAMDEFFADPIVRLRIGMIVTRAMSEPTSPRRRAKPRQAAMGRRHRRPPD
jgi:hypothetical protein